MAGSRPESGVCQQKISFILLIFIGIYSIIYTIYKKYSGRMEMTSRFKKITFFFLIFLAAALLVCGAVYAVACFG